MNPYILRIKPTSNRGQVLFCAYGEGDTEFTPTCSLQMPQPLAEWIVSEIDARAQSVSPERLRIAELENQLDLAERALFDRIRSHPYTAQNMVDWAIKARASERGKYTEEEQQAMHLRELAKEAEEMKEFQAKHASE